MAKALLNLGYGSGDPVAFPGFRPLNPWGRPMPRPKVPPRPVVYQLFVETMPTRQLLAVGPSGPKHFLEPLCAAIEQHIAAGLEKDWRNPHLVRLLGV